MDGATYVELRSMVRRPRPHAAAHPRHVHRPADLRQPAAPGPVAPGPGRRHGACWPHRRWWHSCRSCRRAWAWSACCVKEAALGFAIGYLLAIPFWAFEAIGFFIDNQRGASIGATLNPLTGNDSSPLGMLFNQAFMVFVFASGGFLLMLGALYQSFMLWPVLQWQPALHAGATGVAADAWLGQLDTLVRTALLLSAPAIIAMFLAELGLALVSRFAPQLQVFFLAMPIKSALALFVLVMYMGTLLDYSGEWMREHWRSVIPFLQRTIVAG
jgi:type III secretion protein SpaR/YscT/HrcT